MLEPLYEVTWFPSPPECAASATLSVTDPNSGVPVPVPQDSTTANTVTKISASSTSRTAAALLPLLELPFSLFLIIPPHIASALSVSLK